MKIKLSWFKGEPGHVFATRRNFSFVYECRYCKTNTQTEPGGRKFKAFEVIRYCRHVQISLFSPRPQHAMMFGSKRIGDP